MSCLEFLGCLLHFVKQLSAERNFLKKVCIYHHHHHHPHTHTTHTIFLCYTFSRYTSMCIGMWTWKCSFFMAALKNSPTPRCTQTVLSPCSIWCTHIHTYTHTHRVFYLDPSLSPPLLLPLLSLPRPSIRPSISLSCQYTYSHSAGMEHMYLRNVKPLKFTVKAATPPTPSPGASKNIYSQVSSEVFQQWKDRGVTWGPKCLPEVCFPFL